MFCDVTFLIEKKFLISSLKFWKFCDFFNLNLAHFKLVINEIAKTFLGAVGRSVDQEAGRSLTSSVTSTKGES